MFVFLFLFLFSKIIYSQIPKTDALFKTILAKDSMLFDAGFNHCDISQFEDLLSENLKFYHDKDGFSDKTKFISDLKKGICNNTENRQVKRFLLKEKTEIFPLYKNGALYRSGSKWNCKI